MYTNLSMFLIGIISLPDFLKAPVVRIYYSKANKETNKPKDYWTYKAKPSSLKMDEIYMKFPATIAF